jgi:hypothetical protein
MAGEMTFRYVRSIGSNYERANIETANVIGQYITDEVGLPQHIFDWPINMTTWIHSSGFEIETLGSPVD